MLKQLALVLFWTGAAFGQGQAVNQVQGPPPQAWVSQFYYNGSNQVTYICSSPQLAPLTTFMIGGNPALTNIVVASNTATVTFGASAQFWVGQQLSVSGSTTTALNGTYKALTVSGSTVTFTSAGVGDGTYNNAAMTVLTVEPLLNAPLWSIQVFNYPGANLGTSYWAGNPEGRTVPQGLACSSRATY